MSTTTVLPPSDPLERLAQGFDLYQGWMPVHPDKPLPSMVTSPEGEHRPLRFTDLDLSPWRRPGPAEGDLRLGDRIERVKDFVIGRAREVYRSQWMNSIERADLAADPAQAKALKKADAAQEAELDGLEMDLVLSEVSTAALWPMTLRIRGARGAGKSARVRSALKDVLDLKPATVVVALQGMDTSVMMTPETLELEDGRELTILVDRTDVSLGQAYSLIIEELNRAPEENVKALMEALAKHTLMGNQMPWYVVVATENPDNGEYSITATGDAAHEDRFTTIELPEAEESWKTHFKLTYPSKIERVTKLIDYVDRITVREWREVLNPRKLEDLMLIMDIGLPIELGIPSTESGDRFLFAPLDTLDDPVVSVEHHNAMLRGLCDAYGVAFRELRMSPQLVREVIRKGVEYDLSVLWFGPPGCGKTSIVLDELGNMDGFIFDAYVSMEAQRRRSETGLPLDELLPAVREELVNQSVEVEALRRLRKPPMTRRADGALVADIRSDEAWKTAIRQEIADGTFTLGHVKELSMASTVIEHHAMTLPMENGLRTGVALDWTQPGMALVLDEFNRTGEIELAQMLTLTLRWDRSLGGERRAVQGCFAMANPPSAGEGEALIDMDVTRLDPAVRERFQVTMYTTSAETGVDTWLLQQDRFAPFNRHVVDWAREVAWAEANGDVLVSGRALERICKRLRSGQQIAPALAEVNGEKNPAMAWLPNLQQRIAGEVAISASKVLKNPDWTLEQIAKFGYDSPWLGEVAQVLANAEFTLLRDHKDALRTVLDALPGSLYDRFVLVSNDPDKLNLFVEIIASFAPED